MARDGSGTYNRTQNDYAFGEIISETEVNSEFNDIAAALTQSLSKDGQTVPTANLPMGGFKLTGLANGTARTDSAAIGQIQDSSFMWGGTAGGTSDALTIAPSPAITAYAAGQAWRLINQGTPNATTTPTIAISGLANRTIKRRDGSAIAPGDLAASSILDMVDDGTALRLVNFTGGSLAKSVNTARSTVASAATTADIWGAANQIDWTGNTICTGFPAAPQAGVERVLIAAAAAQFTAGANMLIDGIASGSNLLCEANDIVIVRAVTKTQFRLTWHPYKGLGLNFIEAFSANNDSFKNTQTFPAAYDGFIILANDVRPATDGATLRAQLYNSGTLDTGATYHGHVSYPSSAAATYAGAAFAAVDSIQMSPALSNNASSTFDFELRQLGVHSVSRNNPVSWNGGIWDHAATTAYVVSGAGASTGTNNPDGIKFFMSSGNIAEGTFRVYGYRK